MRFVRPGTIDVQDSVRVRSQEIGNHHAMAIEEEPLGAHVRGPRLIGELEQVGDRALELRREHVVGIIAEALVAQRNVWRLFENLLAVATQRRHREVRDSRPGQALFQRIAIVLRQPPRPGKRADVYESLNVMRPQSTDQVGDGAGGVSDGVENSQKN